MKHPDSTLRIALAQIDLFVGDVDGNASRMIEAANQARDRDGADLILFPELALCGYPPEDLLFHAGMRRRIAAGLQRLQREIGGIAVYAGYPEYVESAGGREIFNAGALIHDGQIAAIHRKQCLPNYKVFDEKRYFHSGNQATVVDFKGIKIALLICEDIWQPEPTLLARQQGAQVLLAINASPYELHKQQQREAIAAARVREAKVPLVYLNLLGGQDELVFDGNSFVMNGQGEVVRRAPPFVEGVFFADFAVAPNAATGDEDLGRTVVQALPGERAPHQADDASVYSALVLGVRDYVEKHRFPGVVMGLSGGIDSALTLAIAVDALGPQRVQAVLMPSRYTSQMSIDDATEQAQRMGVHFSSISIEGMFAATLDALKEEFAGTRPDITEENIQARCRGVLLMAISNKTGRMLLTTGNKSEMAVGYATLYGDMNGGFAPIKDCSKLLVYRLANYRNAHYDTHGAVIPQRVIDRPPSAELRADQKDSDSLPPYEVLDPILEAFIGEDLSVDQIAARGFDRETVGRILEMVKRSEYKRRQAPPGVRVSGRAFGRDWRYPITSGYKPRG